MSVHRILFNEKAKKLGINVIELTLWLTSCLKKAFVGAGSYRTVLEPETNQLNQEVFKKLKIILNGYLPL